MAATLKIIEMSIDGHPYTCPDCASLSFTFDGHALIDAFPVWANCPNSHSWEDPLITTGDLKQIQAASTGRQKATDIDTFEIEIGGAVLTGVLHADLTPEDVKAVGRIYWRKLIKPAIRKQKRRAVRAVTRPVKNAAKDTVAAAKAAAIGAAWGLQAGGHEPDPDYKPAPVTKCAACKGKGGFQIDSRLHKTTRVNCSACHGTGEID